MTSTSATLIGEVQTPPMRKLGVFDVDVLPAEGAHGAGVRLNGLVASPSFAAWGAGRAPRHQALLFAAGGKPRCGDRLPRAPLRRGAAVRRHARALEARHVDARPARDAGPACARLHGRGVRLRPADRRAAGQEADPDDAQAGAGVRVGLVLSTQNPVDLDYKAMSNAGTWLVGRLQTENDKARVLEGLRSAAGGTDVAALDAAIGGLAEAPVPARAREGRAPAAVRDAVGDVVPARAADERGGRDG